jgi:Cu(I)/Ag(I) efflux system protein CusF
MAMVTSTAMHTNFFNPRRKIMKKQIVLISLLLSGNAFADMSGMDMSNMPMHKKMDRSNMHEGMKMESATHQGKGKVVEVNLAKSSIKLSHEAIKSLDWPAMTMKFNVANAALLQNIKAGDAVEFELSPGSKTGSWLITRITPLGNK